MHVLKLSIANILDKKLNSLLSVVLLTLGIGLISLLLLLNKQLEDQFKRNIRGIDMVVGAKGSPLQLILSSIYQVDAPTGNIPMDEVNKLRMNPFVKSIIPLSMGDNYQGYRLVGTTGQYLDHFEAKLASGRLFNHSLEVVIGSKVAAYTGLKIGETFESAHGLDKEGEGHEEKKYVVTGILQPNGWVTDQLILTSLQSIWDIHRHDAEEGEVAASNVPDADRSITSAFIKFRNPMGLVSLPRHVNQNTSMQAALPSIEINRLLSLLGVGIETLHALATGIIIIAALSVFISLYKALKDRKYEMALMLSMGASRLRLFYILLLEGLVLAMAGYLFGMLFSRIGLWLFSRAAEKDFHYSFDPLLFLREEAYLFVATLCIVLLATIIPSAVIYRLNISHTLAQD